MQVENETWTEADELLFIDSLEGESELDNYISAAHMRSDWAGMDGEKMIKYANARMHKRPGWTMSDERRFIDSLSLSVLVKYKQAIEKRAIFGKLDKQDVLKLIEWRIKNA